MAFKEIARTETFYATLHIAGSYEDALRFCKKYSYNNGYCFQLVRCQYQYTGGTEDGMTVRVIDYPRFPKDHNDILKTFTEFACALATELCQKSFTIESTLGTKYFESDEKLHSK